jgi:hypothetical protein
MLEVMTTRIERLPSNDQSGRAIRDLFDLHAMFDGARGVAPTSPADWLGYGWWSRTVRSAEAVRQLYGVGLDGETSPLTRNVIVHAVATVWLTECPEAAVATSLRDFEEKKPKLHARATGVGWDLADVPIPTKPEGERPDGWNEFREFEDMAAVAGTPSSYVAYWVESSFCHATGLSADAYLTADDNGLVSLVPAGTVRGVPLRGPANFAVVASRACARFVGNRRLLASVERIGKTAGLPMEFGDNVTVTPEAAKVAED